MGLLEPVESDDDSRPLLLTMEIRRDLLVERVHARVNSLQLFTQAHDAIACHPLQGIEPSLDSSQTLDGLLIRDRNA